MMVGLPSHGAAVVTFANLLENSPNVRCCDRCRIRPNEAMSQNAVVPPLLSRTSYPSGSENNWASPVRTRPTTDFTGFCRCEVPMYVEPDAASAASCSGRTFDGPHPKRPSAGLRSAGMAMAGFALSVTRSRLLDLLRRSRSEERRVGEEDKRRMAP